MKAALSHLRRLGASLMLVAMASFVLHGAAMAGSHARGGSAQCQPQVTHVHQIAHAQQHGTAGEHAVAHHHGDGVVHFHASDGAQVAPDQPGAGPEHKAADNHSPCCSMACAVTLAASEVAAVAGPTPAARASLPASQQGFGTDPNGLKRPPRTPSIA